MGIFLRGFIDKKKSYKILEFNKTYNLPFSSIEKTITIEEAVEKIFNNEQVELVGREA